MLKPKKSYKQQAQKPTETNKTIKKSLQDDLKAKIQQLEKEKTALIEGKTEVENSNAILKKLNDICQNKITDLTNENQHFKNDKRFKKVESNVESSVVTPIKANQLNDDHVNDTLSLISYTVPKNVDVPREMQNIDEDKLFDGSCSEIDINKADYNVRINHLRAELEESRFMEEKMMDFRVKYNKAQRQVIYLREERKQEIEELTYKHDRELASIKMQHDKEIIDLETDLQSTKDYQENFKQQTTVIYEKIIEELSNQLKASKNQNDSNHANIRERLEKKVINLESKLGIAKENHIIEFDGLKDVYTKKIGKVEARLSKKKNENRVLRALHRELKGLQDNKENESFSSETQSAKTLKQYSSMNEIFSFPEITPRKVSTFEIVESDTNLDIKKMSLIQNFVRNNISKIRSCFDKFIQQQESFKIFEKCKKTSKCLEIHQKRLKKNYYIYFKLLRGFRRTNKWINVMVDKLTHNPPIEYQVSYWRLRDFRIYGNLISANKLVKIKKMFSTVSKHFQLEKARCFYQIEGYPETNEKKKEFEEMNSKAVELRK